MRRIFKAFRSYSRMDGLYLSGAKMTCALPRIEPLEQGIAPLFASFWHVLLFQMPFRSNEQIPTLRHYPGRFSCQAAFPA
ncbi:hypothetical protein [Brucella ovis]|nr:hypothetical protein [Brucella ovis]